MATASDVSTAAKGATSTVTLQAREVDWFDRIIKVAGVLTVLVGLFFTNKQLEANRQTLEAATWNDVSKQWLELDKILIRNPDTRRYIYHAESIEMGDQNYHKAMAHATYVLDFIDYTLNPIANTEKVSTFIIIWTNYARRVFSNSPAVCRELMSNKDNYTEITVRLAEKHCQRPN
jgi:hypothetical protein